MKVLKSLVILLLAAALLAGCAASPSSVVHSGTPFKLLVLNCGSSSVKFRLYEMESETLLAKGAADRIGVDGHLRFEPQNGGAVLDEDRLFPTHEEAIAALLDLLTSPGYGVLESLSEIRAVGQRVVHGGESLKDSVRIDGEVLKTIRDCISLAPLSRFTAALTRGIEWVFSHSAEETARMIAPQFPGTSVEVLTGVVQRYKDIDAWNGSLCMEPEALDRLQAVMQEAGELKEHVDFQTIVDNTWAEKAKG